MIPGDEYIELFKSIVDTAHDGIIILENFKITFTNKMFQYMLNLEEFDIIDKNITQFIHSDDIFLIKDNIIMADKTPNYISHIKIRFINTFGEIIFSELTIKKIKTGIGHKIIITANDISHLISQEDMENKYNLNLKFLNNTAIDFIRMVDFDEIYTFIIEKISQMFTKPIIIISSFNNDNNSLTIKKIHGLDLVTESILKFLKIETNKLNIKVPNDIQENLISGKLYEIKGGLFEITLGKIPSFAANIIEKAIMMDKLFAAGLSYSSQIYGSIAIISRKSSKRIDRNLIETFLHQASATIQRKNLEIQLDKEKDFQSRLIESSPFPLIITNKKGFITYSSKNIHSVTGYTHNEIIGKHICKFTNSIYFKIFKEHYNALKYNSPISNVYLIKHKDNREIFCEINADILFDSSEEKRYILAIIDITERINYEVELEYSKNKAEESDKLKTAFLSNLSHEIRTPMNGIIGFSELLKNNSLTDSEKKQFIEIINNSGKQLLSLINDIIDISRIESGEMSIDKESFDINELLKDLVDYFNGYKRITKFETKNIEISLTADPNFHKLICTDKNKLHQILTNLITNSLKFTEAGFIKIGYKQHDENHLKIFVKDSGIGIDKSKHSIIFERFRQVDDSTQKKYSGSGLGLAITKSLVELLGGSIHIDSKVGEGTNIYFYLPFQKADKKEPLIEKDYTSTIQSSRNILIAEDDDNNYKFLSVYIHKMYGLTPVRAKTGLEVIDIFNNNKTIDMIFMDMNMPEMDGYEATKEIRKTNKDIIIIANTAYATNTEIDKCLKAGCNDYLSKPINIEKFEIVLKKYL
ncbi:MAG: hypothetical protein A2015_08635 [Spirochaetes bacterium GWF1_31_7]|nr:MAG: hypothetical protein A2Y30_07025 [Spirochaetes bacterium GWE1_32_154]OHD47990.1 MAG: hypothetical protein A2015_08635 [Spirochaetes bacterium GWF1_31_7]OHD48081.1 MAG: hypothetical protein A2Y29_07970 [Spirochaetes bacterium GWE2_31_10]OHD79961.1 MAG: hypothetical protein A2355_00055 [Spirochaetes bacterium RIFOXYB1_FULL_32_8]HBI36414.1 hypothetical protein [Spirochaetia bacterium]